MSNKTFTTMTYWHNNNNLENWTDEGGWQRSTLVKSLGMQDEWARVFHWARTIGYSVNKGLFARTRSLTITHCPLRLEQLVCQFVGALWKSGVIEPRVLRKCAQHITVHGQVWSVGFGKHHLLKYLNFFPIIYYLCIQDLTVALHQRISESLSYF